MLAHRHHRMRNPRHRTRHSGAPAKSARHWDDNRVSPPSSIHACRPGGWTCVAGTLGPHMDCIPLVKDEGRSGHPRRILNHSRSPTLTASFKVGRRVCEKALLLRAFRGLLGAFRGLLSAFVVCLLLLTLKEHQIFLGTDETKDT